MTIKNNTQKITIRCLIKSAIIAIGLLTLILIFESGKISLNTTLIEILLATNFIVFTILLFINETYRILIEIEFTESDIILKQFFGKRLYIDMQTLIELKMNEHANFTEYAFNFKTENNLNSKMVYLRDTYLSKDDMNFIKSKIISIKISLKERK